MDVYVATNGTVKLMDFNPVGGSTAPLLFDWAELGYTSTSPDEAAVSSCQQGNDSASAPPQEPQQQAAEDQVAGPQQAAQAPAALAPGDKDAPEVVPPHPEERSAGAKLIGRCCGLRLLLPLRAACFLLQSGSLHLQISCIESSCIATEPPRCVLQHCS